MRLPDKWIKVFGFWPVPLYYVDSLPMGGRATYYWLLCWIEILYKYRYDEGLEAHEVRHCEQQLRSFGLHALRNRNRDYRLEAEAECYAVQYLKTPSPKLSLFVDYLFGKYDLRTSRAHCEVALKEWTIKLRLSGG